MKKTASKQESADVLIPNTNAQAVVYSKQRGTNSKNSAANAADRIISRIDELHSRIAALTDLQAETSSDADASAKLEQLLEKHLSGCRTEIDEKNESLISRVGDALSKQNDAITAIAISIQEFQQTLATKSKSDGFEPTPPPRDLLAQHFDNPERPPQETKVVKTDASTWDQIRNAFLLENSDSKTPSGFGTPQAAALPEVAVVRDAIEPEDDYVVCESYTPPDTSGMDEAQLRAALPDQERVISMLVGQLQRKFRSRQTLNAVQLRELKGSLPEEMTAKVDLSLKALDQQVRLGELELSLERARVSRQLSHLEETRRKLESNARIMGFTISPDGQIGGRADAVAESGTKGRRWLGVLGFGN